jgi:O-antigen/teichoic acid export membrane protein
MAGVIGLAARYACDVGQGYSIWAKNASTAFAHAIITRMTERPADAHPPPLDAGAAADHADARSAADRRALFRRLSVNTGVKFATEIVGRGLMFLLVYLAQRRLGPAMYGEFTYAIALGFVVMPLIDFGLQLIVAREVARDETHAARIIGTGLTLRLVFALAGLGAVAAVSATRPLTVQAAALTIGVACVATSFAELFGYALRGFQRLQDEAVLLLSVRVLTVAIGVWALVAGAGLGGLAAAYVLGGAAGALLGYAWLARIGSRPIVRFDPADSRRLLRPAWPLGAAIVLSIAYTRTAVFVLDATAGAEAVGVFGVAQKLTEPWAVIPATIMAAVFPAFARDVAADRKQAGYLRARTVALLSLAGGLFAAAGVFAGPWLLSVLYGPEYAGSVVPFQILSLAAAPAFVTYALTHFLVALDRQRLVLWFNAGIFATNLALCLMLIPRLGPAGGAGAILASECLLCAACWIAVRSSARDAARHAATPVRARHAGVALLALAMACLPFEARNPIFTVGPFMISNVELVLYVMLAWWLASEFGRRRLRWTPVHTAVLAFGAAVALAAVCAPTDRPASVKFALRTLGGCALFFAAASLVSTPRRAAAVVGGTIAGALLSAAGALAEYWIPRVAEALLIFKTGNVWVGTMLRPSGTFQHPNIGSMYWEAALPLLLVAGTLWAADRPERSRPLITVAAALLLCEAILLGASRAGLLVAAAATAGLAGVARNHFRAAWAPAILTLLGLVGLALSPQGSLVALRLQSDDQRAWYRPRYLVGVASLTLNAAETTDVPVTIRNAGLVSWTASGTQRVVLGYHWRDPAVGKILPDDGMRTPLPRNVRPGGAVRVVARVRAPDRPGEYLLQWDLVREHVSWFSVWDGSVEGVHVRVNPSRAAATRRAVTFHQPPTVLALPVRQDLWRGAIRMWRERPLLGIGPDNFRKTYGPYLGLDPFDTRVHANSLYVESLVTTGLLGLFTLGWLAVTIGTTAWRGWRAAADRNTRLLILGCGLALSTFFIHGLIDYFLPFTPTYGLFWGLLGVTTGLIYPDGRDD